MNVNLFIIFQLWVKDLNVIRQDDVKKGLSHIKMLIKRIKTQ